ncbi:hypothetical protein C0J52_13964 [Blattella germanica]|nr:hypothetical protein C0J52_13964 [Blattella germanica]
MYVNILSRILFSNYYLHGNNYDLNCHFYLSMLYILSNISNQYKEVCYFNSHKLFIIQLYVPYYLIYCL